MKISIPIIVASLVMLFAIAVVAFAIPRQAPDSVIAGSNSAFTLSGDSGYVWMASDPIKLDGQLWTDLRYTSLFNGSAQPAHATIQEYDAAGTLEKESSYDIFPGTSQYRIWASNTATVIVTSNRPLLPSNLRRIQYVANSRSHNEGYVPGEPTAFGGFTYIRFIPVRCDDQYEDYAWVCERVAL